MNQQAMQAVCEEIKEIMATYREQDAAGGVDTPGGLAEDAADIRNDPKRASDTLLDKGDVWQWIEGVDKLSDEDPIRQAT